MEVVAAESAGVAIAVVLDAVTERFVGQLLGVANLGEVKMLEIKTVPLMKSGPWFSHCCLSGLYHH